MRYVVLTGDLVSSSALSGKTVARCIAALDSAMRDVASWDADPRSPLTGFRQRGGDGWQAAIAAPARALRVALYLRACLKRIDRAFDTRIALAEDTGHLPPDGDTNAAHGPAFTASGRLLAALSGHARMGHARGGADHAAALLADHIVQGWTAAQARAVAEMLPPGTGPRAEAAARLGISRQAVDQALHAAGYPALLQAVEALEQATDGITEQRDAG